MRKILLILMCLFTILVSCNNDYRPESEWHLTTNESFIIHGKGYIDYYIELIDSYEIEYESNYYLESTLHHDEIRSTHILDITFHDGFVLNIMIKPLGHIFVGLNKNDATMEEAMNINSIYLEIIHQIALFSNFNYSFDSNPLPNFIEQSKQRTDLPERNLFSGDYSWHISSELTCHYRYGAQINEDGNGVYVGIILQDYLTDKNLWNN